MVDERLRAEEIIQAAQPAASDVVAPNMQPSINYEDKIEAVASKVEALDAKFEVWQGMVEPMLASTQAAMQYDNYVLTATAIFVAIAGVLITKWYSSSKNEAIEEAISSVDSTIARGILPPRSKMRSKIIDTIINSHEFQQAVDEIFDFRNESKEADDSRAEDGEIQSAQITDEDLQQSGDSDD